MSNIFQIQFRNRHIAYAVKFNRGEQLKPCVDSFNLVSNPNCQRPILVLVGGASGMTPNDLEQLSLFFSDVICPLVEHRQGIVIDGGTDAGVMRLMGEARDRTGSTFPLIGVAAQGTVCLPQQHPPILPDYAVLEPNHTHFILVPGGLWGDESPWMAQTATLLTSRKSLTILVNGGKIAWQDVANSVKADRPVLVLAGSGRTADELAKAIVGDRGNPWANQLVDSGLLSAVELQSDLEELKAQIQVYF
ncbi:MAG: hypothetical protein ACOYME_14200 [Prochlorotrichaceae cyanobacterium]|jgi:hypothetical protein